MYIENEISTRTVLAKKHYSKDSMLGEITPIFEITNGIIVPLTEHNFCPTMKVFIKSHYEEIEKNFEYNDFFKIDVSVTERDLINSDTGMLKSKYVASGKYAEKIKAKDFFQIIKASLPDPSDRLIELNDDFPGTSYIFVEDGEFIYGPFKWLAVPTDLSPFQIKIDFIDTPLPNVKLMQYQIYQIDLENPDVEDLITISSRLNISMVADLSILQAKNAVVYKDYSSDEEVVKFCAKMAADYGVKLIDKKQIETVVATLSRNPKSNSEFYRKRLSRFSKVGGEISEIKQEVVKGMFVFFETEAGKNVISNYIDSHQEYYLSKIRKERESEIQDFFSEKQGELREIEDRIRELNKTKSQLNIEVEKKREAANSDVELQAVYSKQNATIEENKKKVEELEIIIQDKINTFKEVKNLESINDEIIFNQKLRDRLIDEVKELKREHENSDTELRKKLSKMRPYVDHITGGYIGNDSLEEKNISVSVMPLPSSLESKVERQKMVIDCIQRGMRNFDRHFEDWQIANFIISLQQSFITFFAGLPGVGKTSLARALADVQGLNNRCHEVSVARGWTGQKDLIGYHNPLTNRFQPSNTGLYSFLNALNEEPESENAAMAYIMLDEANLSPIEHYWSLFMAMTDGNLENPITLGEEKIRVPQNLRFIGTINYDGTTESLSARIIDRAPIIILDSADFDSNDTILHDVEKVSKSLPISSSQMNSLFGTSEKIPEFTDEEKIVYSKIKSTLMQSDYSLGRPINISPRKEIAILQFCNVARAFMREYQDLRALDVAVLQHILPLVRGSGAPFSQRMRKLKQELETSELSLSAEYVNRIISLGEHDLQTYDFFCW